MQLTQQVYVAEEWVRNAHDEVKAKALSRHEVEKTLRALKEEHVQLSKKLKEADKACLSVEAGLKAIERQMKDQWQKLHITEIDLATESKLFWILGQSCRKLRMRLGWPGKLMWPR